MKEYTIRKLWSNNGKYAGRWIANGDGYGKTAKYDFDEAKEIAEQLKNKGYYDGIRIYKGRELIAEI